MPAELEAAEARANLRIFIESARRRGEAMDHTLFHGPPGLGKTTLAQIMARELGVGFRMTSGPVLAKAGDLVFKRPEEAGLLPGQRLRLAGQARPAHRVSVAEGCE